MRLIRHMFCGPWRLRWLFPKPSLEAIETAIAVSERSHLGEIRFAVESALEIGDLLRNTTARQRAVQVFAECRVWDTEYNTGVLVYLLLADRRVEIVADRGIHAKVGEAGWAEICRDMETQFRLGKFESGVIGGIEAISAVLGRHFPASGENPNEMPNQPIIV